MLNYFPFMHKLLLGFQFFAALVGILYFPKLRNTHWRWFSIYLVVIFFQEIFWTLSDFQNRNLRAIYYAFIGIPIQYLFFYWLFAYKSLKNKNLFYFILVIYLATYIPIELYYGQVNFVNSINLTIGTILLTFLIGLEFKKQIKNDNILKFKQNKMFYISVGVILFYIGTYPFFAFHDILKTESYAKIWNSYYLYYLLSNYFMYLLFTASFLWGKHLLK